MPICLSVPMSRLPAVGTACWPYRLTYSSLYDLISIRLVCSTSARANADTSFRVYVRWYGRPPVLPSSRLLVWMSSCGRGHTRRCPGVSPSLSSHCWLLWCRDTQLVCHMDIGLSSWLAVPKARYIGIGPYPQLGFPAVSSGFHIWPSAEQMAPHACSLLHSIGQGAFRNEGPAV